MPASIPGWNYGNYGDSLLIPQQFRSRLHYRPARRPGCAERYDREVRSGAGHQACKAGFDGGSSKVSPIPIPGFPIPQILQRAGLEGDN